MVMMMPTVFLILSFITVLSNLKVNFNDAQSYNNYRESLKKMTESTSGSYSGYEAGGLYTKQNILKERNIQKAIDIIQKRCIITV